MGGPSKAEVGAGGEKLGGEGDGSIWGRGGTVISGMWEGFPSLSFHLIFNSCPITPQSGERPNVCLWLGTVAYIHFNSQYVLTLMP